jgi:hypothetical protein
MPAKPERHLCANTAALQWHAEIAHLKMTLSPDQVIEAPSPRYSRNDFVPELSLNWRTRAEWPAH